MRYVYVVTALICATLTAIGISYGGITLHTFYKFWTNDDVAREAFYSMLAAMALPMFFLVFITLCAIYTMGWALRKLFNRRSLFSDRFDVHPDLL